MNLKEVTSYYNLTHHPFTKEIPTEHLLTLPSMQRPLSQLSILAEAHGIGLLTGKSGSGKSCLLRAFTASLNPGLFRSYYFCHSSVSVIDFYSSLAACMGLVTSKRRAAIFRAVKEHVLALNESSHIHPLLIIDEAHLLNTDILKELRLITNFHIDSVNALTVLLCGSEELKQRLALSILEPLANSITVSAATAALPPEETVTYLEERIKYSGGAVSLFTKGAMHLIHQASGGILRQINTIASGALLKAFTAGSAVIEQEHVQSILER